MSARMQPLPRECLQRITHIDQRTLRLRLNKTPFFRFGMFEFDPPLGAKNKRERPAVGMGVVAAVGHFRLGGIVKEFEACFVGVIDATVAVVGFEAVGAFQRKSVGEVGE